MPSDTPIPDRQPCPVCGKPAQVIGHDQHHDTPLIHCPDCCVAPDPHSIVERFPFGVMRWRPGPKLPATVNAGRWVRRESATVPYFSAHIEFLSQADLLRELQRVCANCDEGWIRSGESWDSCVTCNATGYARPDLHEFVREAG